MVFTSLPSYLDPPNWQQQPNHPPPGSGNDNHLQNNHQQLPPPISQPPMVGGGGVAAAGSSSSIRPGSMADRARQAKLPQPEQALKCPRCDSTNTKFCYFNNYSLTQPRHFCKTCRRYWTRGGALRSVPVGGGCRRNKRSSKTSSSSKSPGTSEQIQTSHGSASSSIPSNSTSFTTSDTLGHMTPQSQLRPHLPFMSSLHNFTDPYGSTSGHLGLSFSGIQPPPSGQLGIGGLGMNMNFHHMGSTSGGGASGGVGGGSGNILSTGMGEQWRLQPMQHFTNFLSGNLEPSPGLYSFQGDQSSGANMSSQGQARPPTSSSLVSQLDSVKMEDNQAPGLNLSRQLMGMNNSNATQGSDHQYWGGSNAWTDLSGFTSSSTTHLL